MKKFFINFWPPLAYLALSLLFTWPLALNLSTHGISLRSGDLWQNLWNLWWTKHAIFELGVHPFRTDLLFYPDSPSLYLHALNPLGGLISSPLQVIFGLVLTFNLMVLAAYSLSGWAMYALGRYIGLSQSAAFLAGLIFAFSPILSSELNLGQLEQLSVGWLPLFCLFYSKAVNAPSFQWSTSLLAALFLLCTVLTTWYYALDLLIFAALVSAILLYQKRTWEFLRQVSATAIVCLVAILPLLILTARAAASTPTAAARPSSVLYNSANPLFFLVPGDSFLWRSKLAVGQEFEQFLGYGTLALAILAILVQWSKARLWLSLLAIFVALSLGPQLRVGLDDYISMPLPGEFLQALPVGGNFFRVPVRFVAFAMLPLGLLAGLGLDWLVTKWKLLTWQRLAIVTVTCLVIFLEYFPGTRPLANLELNKAAWQQIKAPGAVLSLPYSELTSLQMYEQTQHGQPVIGGYLARLPGFNFLEQAPIIRELTQTEFKPPPADFVHNDWEQTLLRALNVYGIGYLVIHPDKMSVRQLIFLREQLRPALGTTPPIAMDGKIEIYRVPTPSEPNKLISGWLDIDDGWYDVEINKELGHYFWAQNEATLTLLNPNPTTQRFQIEWTLFSFGQNRQVDLALNGQAIGQKTAPLAAQVQSFELELPPGHSTLSLKSSQVARSPLELDPKNKDRRPLGFGLARLSLSLAQ